MKHIKIQKIYTYPYRKLYGEYCSTSLLELRLKIIKGEIKEQLCFLDENDTVYCFDEFGNLNQYHNSYLEEIHTKLLMKILDAQMNLRKKQRITI